ncbi:MAG: cysteine dioxygenase family protein [Candidatus Thalassarchaeaceae archaeon]|nr:cysteine dioxygenase family protein [Candidatus Thalassarchaeaceae archaeon]
MVAQVPLSEDVRSTLLSRCDGLRDLTGWLDDLDRRPGLDELDSRLSALEVNIGALEDCIGYSHDGYQRNVIKKNEHYELVAICWTMGQDTPIHDHIGSDCAFLIVSGVSTETTYATNQDGLAYPVSERRYLPGEVCAAAEPDIHRVSNEESTNLINLHIYTPPLSGFKTYSPVE